MAYHYRISDGAGGWALDLPEGRAFAWSGVKYPRNWTALASDADRAALGMERYTPTPPTPPTVAETRARLAAAITAEQIDRRTRATAQVTLPASQTLAIALDQPTQDVLSGFQRRWDRGEAGATLAIGVAGGSVDAPSGVLRMVALALEDHLAALIAASAARQAALGAAADADLSGFDVANDAFWPSEELVVDATDPATWPSASGTVAARLAALETAIAGG